MHRILLSACLPALVFLTPRPGFAQTTGTISGAVRDASGAVAPGAKVTATNEGTNLTRAVDADNAGQYIIPQLPVGSYRVRVEKEGFAPFVQSGVNLQANTTVQDDIGFNIVEDKVHVHDLQATILHCLGFDHTRLTYRHQGRDFRLTDVAGEVKKKLLA